MIAAGFFKRNVRAEGYHCVAFVGHAIQPILGFAYTDGKFVFFEKEELSWEVGLGNVFFSVAMGVFVIPPREIVQSGDVIKHSVWSFKPKYRLFANNAIIFDMVVFLLVHFCLK